MKRLLQLLPFVGIAAAALTSFVSCGGNDIKCGAGTTNQSGTCVADSTCGTGTTLMGGQCVPDGSVICQQGTVFNTTSGKCELDPTACAAGTALVGGHCIPEDDALSADLQEAAEPNDQTGAGMFNAPALNQQVTLHGCVTPRAGAADDDPWIVTATGPTLLEVTADGVHGLAGAFAVIDGSDNPKLATWQRLGVNLTGDTSKRQVFLPAAGDYVLLMTDSRQLLLGGEATGSANTCYFGTVKTVAMPAATALTFPQVATTDDGFHVKVYSFDAAATGDILDMTENTTSSSMVAGFVVMRNNVLSGVGAADTANGFPPFWTAGGLNTTGDQVQIVVDNEYNFSLTPQDYTLDNFHIGAQALPLTGTTVTLTKHNGQTPTAPYWDSNYLYFDVAAAGQVVHFNLTSSVSATMRIVRRDIFTPAGASDSLAVISSGGTTTFQNQFVRFAQPGRYYFVVQDPAGVAAATYMVTSTLTNQTTTAATYGTPMATQALGAQGSNFYSLDVQATNEWIEVGIPAAANWGIPANNARVSLYDLAGEGWLNNNYAAIQTGTQPITGAAPLGRVILNDAHDYLIRVENTGTPGTGPTFTFATQERAHVQLGAIVAGTPIVRTNMDTVAAGAVKRFLILGTSGNALRVNATPTVATVDIKLDKVNADETSAATSDTGAAGAAEALSSTFGPAPGNFMALVITNKSATTASNVNTSFNATMPIPFVNICPTGTMLPAPFNGTADDNFSAVQTLPAGFNYYGAAVTQFIVGANGFLAFGGTNPACTSAGCWNNVTMPTAAAPNNVVAPYWIDLAGITVCRKDDAVANTVTVQWSGRLFGEATTVQFQAVLHQNGTVDFIYGPNQQVTNIAAGEDPADGTIATVGVENATGTAAHLIEYDTPGSIGPSTSSTTATP